MSANVRTDCFYNLTIEERMDFMNRENSAEVDGMFKVYHGYMMVPFALIALSFASTFIVTIRAIRLRRVSRKHYVLLLNRAIGDVLAAVTALANSMAAILMNDVSRDFAFLAESFFFASFWSALVSYTSLSVLKLYAVWKPLNYRNAFTFDKCVYIIVFSWIAFILICFVTMGVTALVRVQTLSDWSGCKAETCLRIMYRTRNTLTCFVYLFTVIVFLLTVALLKRAERNAMFDARKESRTNHGRAGKTRSLFLLVASNCFFQIFYAENMTKLAFIRTSLLCRIILDPLVSFITDYQIRNIFLDWIGVSRTCCCYSARVQDRSTISTDSGLASHAHQLVAESPKRKSTSRTLVEND